MEETKEQKNNSPTINDEGSHQQMENEDEEDELKNSNVENATENVEKEKEEKPRPVGQRFLVFCDSHPSSFRYFRIFLI